VNAPALCIWHSAGAFTFPSQEVIQKIHALNLSKPDCSDGGATLFLAGADHERYGKVKWTRQINLQSATVSLQVVISLCKRKETAALKFKAAVSYRRVDGTAVRRLFFFCRRAADFAELVQRFITGYS